MQIASEIERILADDGRTGTRRLVAQLVELFESYGVESGKPKEAEGWRDIASAPKDGTPVLVHLSAKDIAKRDGWHGPAQVAANRGRGWISIPGMWSCTPIAWRPIRSAMLSAAGDGR